MNVIGISFGFHESSACLFQDGRLVFACAEERLSRIKQDWSFPVRAIQAALDHGRIQSTDVDHVAIAWPRPHVSHLHDAKLMLTGLYPVSLQRIERTLWGLLKGWRHGGGVRDYVLKFGQPRGEIHFIDHHYAHALSAYCLSGFDKSAILIVDGRGASEATTLWSAEGPNLKLKEKYTFPDSLGLFYARMTEVLGFKPYADEWKVMGLAAYGKPEVDLSGLIQSGSDRYVVAGRRLLGRGDEDLEEVERIVGPRRTTESEMEPRFQNTARSAQDACETALLALLRRVTTLTGSRKLCMAGGVALNCKANGRLLQSGMIDEIYIQPAAGDDGACIGAALAVFPMVGAPLPRMNIGHSYLGLEYSDSDIENVLRVFKLPYRQVDNPAREAAELLARNHLIGWVQGRMEFGPRALGNRSILAHPGFADNTSRVNEAVKFREVWRPFAPSVLEEAGHLFFENFSPSPYMLLSFWANRDRAHLIPAVVHHDGSCRVQSIGKAANPLYHQLVSEFNRLTGLPVVLNTSFNLKGEPIVCSPRDAVRTFYTSGLDDLVIGNFVVSKQ